LWSDADIIHLHDTPSLSKYGTIIDEAIRNIPEYYPHVVIDKYCIMPDHIHLIVFIHSGNNERMISANSESSLPTLSTIVGQMKRYVSKQIGFSIWQKSFYEHIIRNEKGYQDVWQYIDGNPVKWKSDINYKQEF
jgi:REP element-mobilizing transposase RayT